MSFDALTKLLMKIQGKPVITVYPEFTKDEATWKNVPAPDIDRDLVKELEGIAKLEDGRPRYIVRWQQDHRINIPDVPEYNENGLIIGIEKGGLFHENPVVIFDAAIGYYYKDDKGFTHFYTADTVINAPEGVLLQSVTETISIGVPRFAVYEWLDKETSPVFQTADYYLVWTCEVLGEVTDKEEHYEQASLYRPFSRFDVEQAKNLYHERTHLTKDEKLVALEEEAAKALAYRTEIEKEQRIADEEMIEKFFKDKEYKQIGGNYAIH